MYIVIYKVIYSIQFKICLFIYFFNILINIIFIYIFILYTSIKTLYIVDAISAASLSARALHDRRPPAGLRLSTTQERLNLMIEGHICI